MCIRNLLKTLMRKFAEVAVSRLFNTLKTFAEVLRKLKGSVPPKARALA